MRLLYSIFTLVHFFLFGCNRPESGISVLRIETKYLHQKASNSSAWPTDSEICFAAELKGPGIPEESTAGECSGSLGSRTGFVESNGTSVLSLSAPRGTDRELKIYLFKKATAAACPSFDQVFKDPTKAQSLYLIGHQQNIELNQSEQDIQIQVASPSSVNSIVSLRPGKCLAPGEEIQAGANLRLALAQGSTQNSQGKVEMKILPQGVLK